MQHAPAPDRRANRLRTAAIPFLVGALLFVAGCGPYPQTIWNPTSEYADKTDWLFRLIIVLGVIVFVLVEGALVFAALRYRRRRDATELPPQIHGDARLEIAWTVVPVIIVGAILLPTIQTIFETQAPAPEGSYPITVVGHQFWWEFQYPNGVLTANEIHMPVGKTISVSEQSADVIHSFWIPAMGGKRDVVPGHTNHLWWTPRTVGEFPGQCAELCGYSHANMRLRAFVDSQADFDAWFARQQQPAVTPAPGSVEAQGEQLMTTRGCASCHAIEGTQLNAHVGPNLTHVGSRTTIAAGVLENTVDNLKRWIHDPQEVKPGATMPALGLNDDELTAVATYLQSLK